MAPESLKIVRSRIGERIAEIEAHARSLKPVDICAKMAAIRSLAADHDLAALEGLADYGEHHADDFERPRLPIAKPCWQQWRFASTRHRIASPRIVEDMRAFSQLLDDLVYTRSRNTKLQQVTAPSAFCNSETSTVTTSIPASRTR